MTVSRILTIVAGTLGGASLATAVLSLVAQVGPGPLLASPGVMIIATPGAHIVSWAIGWPLHQEAALACYALGLLLTAALTGALAGGMVGAVAGGHHGPR